MNYALITSLEYETCCSQITQSDWDRLMQGAKRADKRKINALVKKYLPELFNDLGLRFRNPYNYFKTKTHFVLTHSAIEYFIKYN